MATLPNDFVSPAQAARAKAWEALMMLAEAEAAMRAARTAVEKAQAAETETWAAVAVAKAEAEAAWAAVMAEEEAALERYSTRLEKMLTQAFAPAEEGTDG